ncbi:hypothetical protein SAMN03080615_04350 [Amphritea atlantica]|uniref:Uncharacterized protein n=1 Tax=Amphritea atlantica TaxID=355243 RepID=A0A1H9MAU4_9GAMM|nr:hypothetical protein [Amphritea atlantica]SER20577.1 hypothetical protein SAMN03080615_04350 [Amphritea atlantica]
MTKLIVEIIENPDEKHGCWGIQIKSEGGTTFFDTGYIYEGEGTANREFCKVLENLPSKES